MSHCEIARGNRASGLSERVEQDDEAPRAAVQNAVMLTACVTAQFAQLTINLRAIREGQVGSAIMKLVESLNLILEEKFALMSECS